MPHGTRERIEVDFTTVSPTAGDNLPAMAQNIFTDDVKFEPWWWEAATREAASKGTPLPQKADVAIVGAGFTGLSAALTLARAGRSVVVLDAESPGHGASCRNGGMVGHGHRRGYASLKKDFGEAVARAVVQEGLSSLAFTAELIEREGIACHFQRCGRFRAAWRPEHYEAMEREADFMGREFGLEMELVARDRQSQEIVTEHYYGGVRYPSHGGLHPGLFHQGLLDLARTAGAAVLGHRPVTGIHREGKGFRLRCGDGTLEAREVVVATNGYTGPATPELRRHVVPVCSYLIATEPLGRSLVQSLIPGGRMIVESRNRHCYYRASPDGERVIYGGRAALRAIDPRQGAAVLHRLMTTLYPALAEKRITHAWRGNVAMTRAELPHLGLRDGIHLAMGYCGSGVAMAPYLGHKIALRLLEDPDGRSPLEDIPFQSIPFYSGSPWFLPALDLYYNIRDHLDGPGKGE